MAKFLRTPFLQNTCHRLLLKFMQYIFLESFFASLDKSALLHHRCLMPKFTEMLQVCNQEFFRAGEFSRNQGTSKNISSTTHERKALQGKNVFFFLLETLKTTFKIRALFAIFEKGQGRPPPLPTSSYVPVLMLVCRKYFLLFIQIYMKIFPIAVVSLFC